MPVLHLLYESALRFSAGRLTRSTLVRARYGHRGREVEAQARWAVTIDYGGRVFRSALLACVSGTMLCASVSAQTATGAAPLVIGETFTVVSDVLGEARTINAYRPPLYGDTTEVQLPVLYMPDGGLGEDFLHIAGLLQVSVMNGTMRPFLLVGIENTERRRDLTGPTAVAQDRAIAPRVGGSAAFRRFIRTELMPSVNARYRTTGETGIMGESLAGLFVVETFLVEPDLFNTYIAFDPSLWWNDQQLINEAGHRLRSGQYAHRTFYLASSREEQIAVVARRLADALEAESPNGLSWQFHAMPDESHATIFHPAALAAFRRLFRPSQTDAMR